MALSNKQVPFGFPRSERLNSRKVIEELLASGSTISCYPFKLFFRQKHEAGPVQIAISIPKKRIKKAVSRTLIKRRIREVYRQEKGNLHQACQDVYGNKGSLDLFLIYTSSQVLEYFRLEAALKELISTLCNKIHEKAV